MGIFNSSKKQTFRINPVFISNNGAALIAAARKGVGLTFLPEFFSAIDLAEKKLQHVLIDYYQDMPISAIYPYSHYLLPKVRLCIDFLVETLSE
jgi:DNA-binding transcriptional LysR family regulator